MTATTAPVLIIGAGPAGLSMACALADVGIASHVLEACPEAELAEPREDGREIALTHRGIAVLQSLGAWQDLPTEAISPLRQARVFDGTTANSLHFDSGSADRLGSLVPNHWLRRIAWQGAKRRPLITVQAQAKVSALDLSGIEARVTLEGGEQLQAGLVIAADSRFSACRRLAGIGAEMRDFGRSVLLCRIEHDRPHEDQALECFHHGHTMAWLPLGGYSDSLSSLVLTLPTDLAQAQRSWSDEQWLAWVQRHSQGRLGRLRLAGSRHHYPLVATYAHRFAAQRFVLVGDAAVGMHPVTAHGYNFGLYGIEVLARLMMGVANVGDATVLARYAEQHRRATWPIYQGTNAVVKLFTDERTPARWVRQGVIRAAERIPPLKALITAQLTGRQPLLRPNGPR